MDLASETGFVRGLPGIPDTVDVGMKILNTFFLNILFFTFLGLLDDISTSSQRLRVKSLRSSLIGNYFIIQILNKKIGISVA